MLLYVNKAEHFYAPLLIFALLNYSSVSPDSFIFAKHSLQYTGRSSRGIKGTLATPQQAAHTASCISLGALPAFLRLSRQGLQRWGSFTKPVES